QGASNVKSLSMVCVVACTRRVCLFLFARSGAGNCLPVAERERPKWHEGITSYHQNYTYPVWREYAIVADHKCLHGYCCGLVEEGLVGIIISAHGRYVVMDAMVCTQILFPNSQGAWRGVYDWV